MTSLRLWNTLGKTLTDIRPHHPDGVLRLYHCGPTVYATPHIGNLRRFLAADLLVRTLQFLGYEVRSVMNITDVGHLLESDHEAAGTDRMVLAAEREHARPEEIAAKYTQEFFEALTSLRAEPAQYYPRATMHIPQMIELTQRLLDNSTAYETSSGVYLDVTKVPTYGKLSGNTLSAIEAGARVDVREEKHHPADFALWIKAPKEHLMQWESPWGRGYPGWHIECSTMAMHALGETLDIHTGGEDNLFPHHENEIAQSERATGKPFAHLWLHNAHLLVDEKKMSKSAGTFITLPDLRARGADPLAFRLLVLQTHYRSKLNFTWQALDGATEALASLRAFVAGLWRNVERKPHRDAAAPSPPAVNVQAVEGKFTEALANDLGSPQALAVVFDLVRVLNPAVESDTLPPATAEELLQTLRNLDRVLALLDVDARQEKLEIPAAIQRLVDEREEARREKDFSRADALRVKIQEHGFEIDDTSMGPRLRRQKGAPHP